MAFQSNTFEQWRNEKIQQLEELFVWYLTLLGVNKNKASKIKSIYDKMLAKAMKVEKEYCKEYNLRSKNVKTCPIIEALVLLKCMALKLEFENKDG